MSDVAYFPYHEVYRRYRMSSNHEVTSLRRVIALHIFKAQQEREAALLAVQPKPFVPPLVIRAIQPKNFETVDNFPSSMVGGRVSAKVKVISFIQSILMKKANCLWRL